VEKDARHLEALYLWSGRLGCLDNFVTDCIRDPLVFVYTGQRHSASLLGMSTVFGMIRSCVQKEPQQDILTPRPDLPQGEESRIPVLTDLLWSIGTASLTAGTMEHEADVPTRTCAFTHTMLACI
jgi:hypothetical protein